MYRWYQVSNQLKQLGLSETKAAELAQISRSTWRKLGEESIEVRSLVRAASVLGLEVAIMMIREPCDAEQSAIAAGYKVLRDGESSWRVHFMDVVDAFRRTCDPRLLLLAPPAALPIRLYALLASITCTLAMEANIDAPGWASRRYPLAMPWFPSETESLKASAILESPLRFRRNGIFVLANFLERV
jgi:hypothetical protein